jgi:hemoglobin/transferrin/lactoferrin receptor protein
VRRASLSYLLVGAVLLWGIECHSADNDLAGVSAYDVDEIVVTASRRPENAFAEPYSINVRDTFELIEVRQARTTPEALRGISGVMVQKTGHGQGSPFIRGFTGLRTLFLIDGIRLNNSTLREGPNQYWNTVDSFAIQKLELVKGPSSVLYGSDAIGGTVNAISREYDDLEGDDGTRGRIVIRGATAESSYSVRPELGLSADKLTVFAGMSLKSFGDLRAGGTTASQVKTGYEDRSADIKLRYALSPTSDLTAAVQIVDQDDAWRVHKTIYGESWQGTTVGNELRHSFDQERALTYLQYHASDLSFLRGGSVSMSLSHHQQNEERIRVRANDDYDIQGVEVGTLGLWGHVDVPVSSGSWSAGLEFYRDSVDSYRDDYDATGAQIGSHIQGPVADDARYELLDAYLQNKRDVGAKTEIVAGLRVASARAAADAVQDPISGAAVSIRDDWSKVTGSLRFIHRLGSEDRARLFGGISQGFRAPNLSDLTRFDAARTDEIETPVFGLSPERFTSYELGGKYNFGAWTGQVAIFHTAIEDMIIRTPTGRVIDGENEISKRNSGDGFVNGLEMQLRYSLSDTWQLFGNLTWMKGEVDTFPDSSTVLVREPLDRQMPAQVNLGSRWQAVDGGAWFEALLSVADDQSRLSTRDRADTDRIPAAGTPGYSYFTIRGGWQLQENWRLAIAAENVFDENYRIHGSGLNEPGRNVVLSAIYNYR